MRKFTLAAVLTALGLFLLAAPPAHAQPRAAAPSFGSDFRSGFARQLGREVAARAVGGFLGTPGFGGRQPFFLPGRGGFYGGGALPAGFFPAPYRGFYGNRFETLRQLEIQRALQLQRLRRFGGFYGAQSFFLPPAAPVYIQQAPPVILQQQAPVVIEQPQAQLLPAPAFTPGYAAAACGALGASFAPGYSALLAPGYAGCGTGAALRSFVPFRGYR